MVEKNEFDKDDFLEKCQDSINYIRFLYCIGMEENNKLKENLVQNDETQEEKENYYE